MTKVYSINTCNFRLDGGAVFGVVPKTIWQNLHKPDERNRIVQALKVMLIIDGDRKIIVDMGLGNWCSEKFVDQYAIENPDFDFNVPLGDFDLTTEDITDLVVTHLHFDHAGGLIRKTDSGIAPAFPDARIWIHKEHWAWAQNPSPKDSGNFLDNYIKFLQDWPKLKLTEGQTQITDNVSLLPLFGHTPGMLTVLAKAEGQIHFFASDIFPTASHLHIPYIMAYDNNPVLTSQEKVEILEKACKENWLIYFPHDPVYDKGYVTKENGKYTIKK
ncbi:MBL fold metallo-hydrolase [Planctomycetota bacterium]